MFWRRWYHHYGRQLFIGVATAAVLLGNWVASGWWEWGRLLIVRDAVKPLPLGWLAGMTAVFLFLPFALYGMRRAWRIPQTRWPVSQKPPQREVLLWFLSHLPAHEASGCPDGVPTWFTPGDDLDADIKELEKIKDATNGRQRWTWEMPLRGVRYHQKLRTLVLLCSRASNDVPGSVSQAHWLRRILRRYPRFQGLEVLLAVRTPGGRPALVACPDQPQPDATGWDFEDFNELSHAVLGVLDALNGPGRGVPDHRVMIDFTGGQKVTSVVAAAVTFNRAVKVQYVQTNRPWAVRGYDLEFFDPDSDGPDD